MLHYSFGPMIDLICTLHFKVHGYTGIHVTSLALAFDKFGSFLHVQCSMICTQDFKVHRYTGTHVTSLSRACDNTTTL